MKAYIIRRLLLLFPLILGVLTIVFLFLRLIPGDPVELMLGEQASGADRELLRQELGLEKPLPIQYVDFLYAALHGDFGKSLTLYPGTPVADILIDRYPYTFQLSLVSIIIAIFIAIPLGIISAIWEDSPTDSFSLALSLLGISIPNFWLGPLLILFLSYRFPLFPMPSEGGWMTIVLPAFTLGFGMSAVLLRMMRTAYLDVLSKDYMRTARGKGIHPIRIHLKHGFKNSLNPVITILGLQLGILLAGAVVTETVFSWPGIGHLVVEAIRSRDYPIIQGCIVLISFSYIIVNLITDLLYQWTDPRITL